MKDIVGYEGIYQIDCKGNIVSLINRNRKTLKPSLSKNGYYVVNLFKAGTYKKFYVHRLIAIHFIPNPGDRQCINHINANRSDNRIENLEWCTHSENMIHAYKLNRVPTNRLKGSMSKQSKPVLMQSISSKATQEFGSIGEAARFIGIKRPGNIQLVLNGKRNHCRGYHFTYQQPQ